MLCEDITYGNSCNFLLSDPEPTIPNGQNDTKIDNSEKYNLKFIIMAVGNLGGEELDEWKYEVSDSTKIMTNEKNGL